MIVESTNPIANPMQSEEGKLIRANISNVQYNMGGCTGSDGVYKPKTTHTYISICKQKENVNNNNFKKKVARTSR